MVVPNASSRQILLAYRFADVLFQHV
jgi:hypothetical protein